MLFNHALVTRLGVPISLEVFHYRFHHPPWQTFLSLFRPQDVVSVIATQSWFAGGFALDDIHFKYYLAAALSWTLAPTKSGSCSRPSMQSQRHVCEPRTDLCPPSAKKGTLIKLSALNGDFQTVQLAIFQRIFQREVIPCHGYKEVPSMELGKVMVEVAALPPADSICKKNTPCK